MSVGLDKQIDQAVSILETNLWPTFNNRIEGRSWVLDRNGKQPEVYLGDNEYDEVLSNDKYDSIVHFHVESNRPRVATSNFNADVWIMFAVNLKAIYGNDTRAVEKAHLAAIKALNYTSFSFDEGDLVTDIEAYNIYDLTEKQQHQFNMQPYYVFRIEANTMYNANADCDYVEPSTTYEVALSSGTGGSASSSLGGEGTYSSVDANSIQGFSATSESGYRFLNWLINSIVSTTYLLDTFGLKINQAYTIVAQFIARYTLTTSVSGNGTISPLGANVYDDGTTVDLTVTPDEDYEIDRVEEDGTPISAPYQVLMDASKAVIAYFVAILTLIQDVFNTTPITESGLHYWPDGSGNDNKVQIKNTQVLVLDGLSYVDTGYNDTSDDISFSVFVKPTTLDQNPAFIFNQREGSPARSQLVIDATTGRIGFHIWTDLGERVVRITPTNSLNQWLLITGFWNNTTKEHSLTVQNLTTPETITDSNIVTGDILTTNTDTLKIGRLGTTSSRYFIGEISNFTYNGITYNFQRGGGVQIDDSSGNGKHGTLIGAVLSQAWGTKSEYASPALLVNGGEIYEDDAHPGDQDYYIYVIKAENGFITPTIPGFTKIEEHEPNLVWDTGNTYDGVQVAGIETDATFDDLIALEDSETIDITKNSTEISNLKIYQ